jgi:propionate catabolism operon transcriptional regulator
MARVRILLVGYRKFSELIHAILPEYGDDADVTIVESVASASVNYQALLREHRPDVVASAGANAAYLETTLQLPVVAQPVTAADVIDALVRARRVWQTRRPCSPTRRSRNCPSDCSDGASRAGIDGSLHHETYSTTDEAAERLRVVLSAGRL